MRHCLWLLQVNRFVEVNFNCLETTVNLETWVLVLEFIGIGGKFVNPELFTRLAQQARIEEMASGTNTSGIYITFYVYVNSLKCTSFFIEFLTQVIGQHYDSYQQLLL